jgi:ABC-2 type transport system permease protein
VRDDVVVYLRLCAADVRSQMQYRLSYTLFAGGTFVSLFLEFVTIWIFFQRFPTIGGWTLGEVAIVYGLASICFGLAEMVCGGFDHFASLIHRGDFDRLLVRPVSPFTQVFSQEFQLRRIARITQGVAVFLIGASTLDPRPVWTAADLAYLAVAVVCGAGVYAALFIIGATLCFWTIQTTEIVNVFTHGGTEMASYPMTVYPVWFRHFFIFLIPLAFVSYYPALYLLGRTDDLGLPDALRYLAPVAAALFLALARLIWGFGVKHYQSTGS